MKAMHCKLVPRALKTMAISASVAVLAGCAVQGSGAVKDLQDDTFEVEGWHSAGTTRIDEGEFSNCFVSSPYKSGITLKIARHSKGYFITLFEPKWALERDKSYPVRLRIDDLWQKKFEAEALTEHGIFIFLGLDAETLRAMRQGSVLSVFAQKETFGFELGDGRATLDRLERCFRENQPQTAGDYQNPFAAEQNPFEASSRLDSGVRPVSLKKILDAATGVEFVVEQASDFTPEAELVYFLDDALYGKFWQEPAAGGSVDGILAVTLASMQSDCSGRAISGQNPARDGELWRARRGFVACEADDLFADVLVLEAESLISVFVTTASVDDAALAEEAGNAIGVFFVP